MATQALDQGEEAEGEGNNGNVAKLRDIEGQLKAIRRALNLLVVIMILVAIAVIYLAALFSYLVIYSA